MKIQLVSIGRAYDQTQRLPTVLNLPDGATVADAIARLTSSEEFRPLVPPTCLVAVGSAHVGAVAALRDGGMLRLREGDQLTLIAPVAGG